ncbi:MAG: PEGA domain-containing protein [Deltaproteobacteria bacterium]|nr:PEGA domain-containing protein [Deltaproteobacteria bacterium]
MLEQLDWDDDDEVTLARDRMLPSVETLQTRIEILGLPDEDAPTAAAEPGPHPSVASDGSEAARSDAEVTVHQALPAGVQLPPPQCPPRRPKRAEPLALAASESLEPPATQPVAPDPIEDSSISVRAIVEIDGPGTNAPSTNEDFATIRTAPFEDPSQPGEAAQGLSGDTLVDFMVPCDLRETTVAVQVSVEPDELDELDEPCSEPDPSLALADEDDSPPTKPSSQPNNSLPPAPITPVTIDVAPVATREAVVPPSPPNVDEVLAELDVLPAADDSPLIVDVPHHEPSYPPPPARQLGSSLPPVAFSDPPPRPAPKRLGGLLALACVALACIVTAVWWNQPRTGTLTVRLRTADGDPAAKAEIFVDGQKRCDTDPCLVDELSPGTKTVKVILPSFAKPQVAQIELAAGGQQVLWVDVPSRQGIELSCPQRSARLVVDGVDRGLVPAPYLEVAPGEHHLRLIAPGYLPWERTIQVAAGKRVEVGEIALTPATPELTVALAGSRARVVLVSPDGSRRALSGPWPRRLEVEPGRYTVLAHRRGHRPFTHHVDITSERPSQRVAIELEPARPAPTRRATATPAVATDEPATETASDDDPYES